MITRYFRLVMVWLAFGLALGLTLIVVFGRALQAGSAHSVFHHLQVISVGGSAWIVFGLAGAVFSYRFFDTRVHKAIVGWMARILNSLLLILVLACAARVLAEMIPGFEDMRLVHWLDWAFNPAWAAATDLSSHVGMPSHVASVPSAPILLAVLLVLGRNGVTWAQRNVTGTDEESPVKPQRHRRHRERDDELERRAKAMSRKVAIASYAEAKSLLDTTEMYLTFLALDVAGSTRMKQGEDTYVIEQAFADYRKLVERMLARHGAYKQTWTPDGQMAAFLSTQSAVDCGKDILMALPDFNENVSRLGSEFRLRIGANSGVVSCDDEIAMEEMSDFTIDIAGHMQKYADEDSIWISAEVYEKLDNSAGFEPNGREVDNRKVYVWRRPE